VTYHGRFAPSPTGPLHFGSLVAAVASWLDARAAGGRWSVRIEDVDAPRTVTGAADAILRALEACGLGWDGPVVRQGDRAALYAGALARLRERGLAYRCRCSRREVADSALRGIEGAVYPGTCRGLEIPAEEGAAERFRVDPGIVTFEDRVRGRVAQDVAREVGDFIVRRRDGLFAYQLAVVVDDADQGVTDVVRGADLLGSTGRQVLLQRALGVPTPRYLHFPVAIDASGEKLSKQTRAQPIDVREGPRLIAQALRFLGQRAVEMDTPARMLAQARAQWDAARIARATTARMPA